MTLTKHVYIAVGPFGWGKDPSIDKAKAIAKRNSRPLKRGQQFDVFLTADPEAVVTQTGTLLGASTFSRVAGKGDFMILDGEDAS